jgi:pyruvate dehydrogenase E2 component (dihydrolipoamide acetyltransferase)
MDIIMPQLGETVLEGVITTWYKKPGEAVAADESLFEVETDKVSTAIPSPVPGVVREILVETGVAVKVGTRLAVVETAAEAGGTAGRETVTAASAVAPAAVQHSSVRSSAGLSPQGVSSLAPRSGRKLSPVVRRLLAEAGLTPDRVQGSGRDGRITKEDVLTRIDGARRQVTLAGRTPVQLETASRAERISPPQLQTAARMDHTPALSQAAAWPDDRVVPLNKIRRATAAHMVRSVATSPHTLQAVEVDFQNVDRARDAKGAEWKATEGFALTYLPFVCAATCEALAEFPLINASFGDDALIVHRRINLGIAVDLGFEGLLVPILRDANHKNVRGLAREIHTLVKKARNNTLVPDELSGGTYTISNSGSFGTLITAPIINQPQVAILSLDGVHKKPTVIEGQDGDAIAIRPIGVLAQSFDHRAFDGAYSAAFLRRLKQALETRNWRNELT